MTEQTRIFVVDDHSLVRSGLKMILCCEPDFELVGEASNAEDAITGAKELQPDIILLDIGMPDMNGLEALPLILANCPASRVIVVTMYDDEAYLQRALAQGASGYILKEAADAELVAAIRAVRQGDTFIYPSLTRHLINLLFKQKTTTTCPSPQTDLTARETQVLRLVALGYTSQQIGTQLQISGSTVETHRMHIMDKLGLHGRAQLVRYALNHGMVAEHEAADGRQ